MTLNSPLTRLKIAIALLLCVAIVLRFSSLDRVFLHDDMISALHAAGHHQFNFFQDLPWSPGEILTVAELQQRSHYPQPETSWTDTIAVLAIGDPQHPPLYYLLLRWWMQIFGWTTAACRSLSVTISLFFFPASYWLAWELFQSRTIAWIAMGISAVSPVYFYYTLEVRPYILWMVMTVISSALLLRACRLEKQTLWRAYAISLMLGVYIFPFTILVSISHGFYLIVVDKFSLTKRVISYLKSCAITFVAFLPWGLGILFNSQYIFEKLLSWQKEPISQLDLFNQWVSNIGYTLSFPFLNIPYDLPRIPNDFLALMSVMSAAFCVFAVYYCLRRSSSHSAIFLGTLMAVTALVLTVPDLISGGRRSVIARYFMPCYLGIQLSIAYFLAHQIYAVSKRRWQKNWEWQSRSCCFLWEQFPVRWKILTLST